MGTSYRRALGRPAAATSVQLTEIVKNSRGHLLGGVGVFAARVKVEVDRE
jgi:hypothetical protein